MSADGVSFRLTMWANAVTEAPGVFFTLPIGTREEVQARRLARRLEKARRRMERDA